jgi:hypothetical protein
MYSQKIIIAFHNGKLIFSKPIFVVPSDCCVTYFSGYIIKKAKLLYKQNINTLQLVLNRERNFVPYSLR